MNKVSDEDVNKLLVCFSGGKTSAYMTYKILQEYRAKYDVCVVFANTGQENDETLDFVNKCDIEFGFNSIWVEAKVTHENRVATTHTIVDYNSADRNGLIFEEMIKKYGIPNKSYPHCTRELKERAIHSFIKSIGWVKGGYYTAIGIRTDEPRRVKESKDYQNIVYPLVHWFLSDKVDVNDFWDEQDFKLELEEHQGNCKWCWKKSLVKHAVLIKEDKSKFNFPLRMEAKYPHAGHNDGIRKRVFFRENRSTLDLFKKAESMGDSVSKYYITHNDDNSGCSESCEMFPMEVIENE